MCGPWSMVHGVRGAWSLGGSLAVCLGMGKRPQSKIKKIENPSGVCSVRKAGGGGTITHRIAPCITIAS